tara:strand:+ start:525 stop:887 length:363 start_codon:yes stop_codon:yes gene_type:complete
MEQYKTHDNKVIVTYKKGRTVIDFDNDELAEFRAKCSASINTLADAMEFDGDMYMRDFFALKLFIDDLKWHFNFKRPKDNQYHGPLIAGNSPKAYYHDNSDRPKKVNMGRPKNKKVASGE